MDNIMDNCSRYCVFTIFTLFRDGDAGNRQNSQSFDFSLHHQPDDGLL